MSKVYDFNTKILISNEMMMMVSISCKSIVFIDYFKWRFKKLLEIPAVGGSKCNKWDEAALERSYSYATPAKSTVF